jgi:flavodoxin
MKSCIVYFSRTGKTKTLAQALSDKINAPIYDIAITAPSIVADYDCLIIGTPVNGARPAEEVTTFLETLPAGNGKPAITFCTYMIFKGKTLNRMEDTLKQKGYKVIIGIAKRGIKSSKCNFQEALDQIAKSIIA